MKPSTIIFSVIALAMTMVGCSDLLNKEPLSSGTDAIYFKTPAQFATAANALYNVEGWADYNGTAIYSSKMDQGSDLADYSSNGGASAIESDFRWNKPYGYIRPCNILLARAAEYSGNKSDIAQPMGTAYFFRAWQHFYLLQNFGGVPIADHVMDIADSVLLGPRKSRYEVTNFIVNDLRTAIPLLPKESTIAAADKGKVSKEAAEAFLARVLLYEATWEKYVPGIGYNLDGDASSSVGAGVAKPSGYPSISDMLTEAKLMAKNVIDEANTGTFALFNQCDSLSYYYLFNIDDTGGNISNYKNLTKSANKEFIFSAKYDYSVRRPGINLGHTIGTASGVNMNHVLADMYLCRNGLPIRVSYTGNMSDAQNNPQFQGYSTFFSEYRNRDYRFVSSVRVPDRACWISDHDYGIACTVVGQPYPTPVRPAVPYNASDPAFSNKSTIYTPTLLGSSGTFNNYGSRKYMPEGANRSTAGTESPDYPLIRLAEVYLIYAEAACELGNGAIGDGDLDYSINKLRDRAGVAHLTNALIANVWDAGAWDDATSKTVCKKLTMLDEIRRERAAELYGEGFRMNDIKRWGLAQINMKGLKLGRHVYGTQYMTATANDASFHGQPVYQPTKYPLAYGVYGDKGEVVATDPDYGRSISALAANLLFLPRDYLQPIPLDQIRLNPALKQNPGW